MKSQALVRPVLRLASMLCMSTLVALQHTPAMAQSTSTEIIASTSEKPVTRPKIALVLSGGGARGFAHIGVLRALRAQNIPVDMVVGTSMGAVIGGAYAAGRSISELEQIVRDTNWNAVLADRTAREKFKFSTQRRRYDTAVTPRICDYKKGIFLPSAAANNAELENALTKLLPDGLRDRPLNRLGLPFKTVASDLVTGELVELSDTRLFKSMRASLAVPGVFSPVRVNQHLVVDGGLVQNLPVELAKSMGADVIIAVNVGTPLAKEQDLNSALDVTTQMLQILTEQNVQRSIRQLRPQDILIAPELEGMSFLDFAQFEKAIQAGEKAAQQLVEQLRPLQVGSEAYAMLDQTRIDLSVQNISPSEKLSLPIKSVEIQGVRHINPAALIAQTGLSEGLQLTNAEIREASTRLYNRGDLENIETEIIEEDGARKVLINARESNSSRNRSRIGLELSSDFSENNDFSLGLMHVVSSLNSYGAEMRMMGKIGNQRLMHAELWQPLGTNSPWYVAPSVSYSAATQDLFANGIRNSRYKSIVKKDNWSLDVNFLIGVICKSALVAPMSIRHPYLTAIL